MTYAQGGLIAAADYNGFVGTSPSSTANQINTVWAVGNGQAGYGQTAISQVSTAGTVTATQWATAVNTLNSIKTHQTGTGTGIGAPTAGSLITYLSTFSSSINTAYSSRASFSSQGSTTTGTVYSPTAVAGNDVTYGEATILTRTATFSSVDAARYFFNAGGQLNFVVTSVANNDGTARSADAVTTIGTYFGGYSAVRATTSGGRTGTGGSVTTNSSTAGYFNISAGTNTVYCAIQSPSGIYTNDIVKFYMGAYGGAGSNAGNGNSINMYVNYTSSHTSGFNDTLNITVNHRVDIVYPESTNLTSSWGTVVIT